MNISKEGNIIRIRKPNLIKIRRFFREYDSSERVMIAFMVCAFIGLIVCVILILTGTK